MGYCYCYYSNNRSINNQLIYGGTKRNVDKEAYKFGVGVLQPEGGCYRWEEVEESDLQAV